MKHPFKKITLFIKAVSFSPNFFFWVNKSFFHMFFSLLFFHYFCQPLCAKLGLVLFDKSLITSLKLVVMGCEKSQGPAAFLHQRVMNKFLLQLQIQNKSMEQNKRKN